MFIGRPACPIDQVEILTETAALFSRLPQLNFTQDLPLFSVGVRLKLIASVLLLVNLTQSVFSRELPLLIGRRPLSIRFVQIEFSPVTLATSLLGVGIRRELRLFQRHVEQSPLHFSASRPSPVRLKR